MICARYFLALVMLCAATPLLGQQGANRDSIHYRNDCRQAAHFLEKGPAHPQYVWATRNILTCSEEAPPALLQLWQRVAADTAAVNYLVWTSSGFRDRRLYENARTIALDRTRPDLVRVGAMVLLHHYADPHSAISIVEAALKPSPGRRVRPIFARSLYNMQSLGGDPLRERVALPVLALLRQIGGSDNHENVAFAAKVLARTLELGIEHGGVQP